MPGSPNNKSIEDLRNLLASKPNGDDYEIIGNTKEFPKTILIKLGKDRKDPRYHKWVWDWDSNYKAWVEMSDDNWTPDHPDINEPRTMEMGVELGDTIVDIIESDIDLMLSLLDHSKVTGYVPKAILEFAITKARDDYKFLKRNR